MAKKYKFSITLKKFGIIALEVVIAGLISYFTENALFLGIIPLLEALRNWIKHK